MADISSKQLKLDSLDSSSIEASGDSLVVKAQGIVDAMVKDDAAITITKLAASTISGKSLGNNLDALTGNANAGISMTSYNGSAAVSDLAVILDAAGGLEFNGNSGIRLEAAVAGAGLAHNAGVLSVNVDDSSIEENSDTLRVKALGITNAMLAGSIANAKLVNDSVTFGTTECDLGASQTAVAGLTALDFAAGDRTLFGSQADGDVLTIGNHINGKVVVKGDLQVDGDTLTVNSTIVQIDDKMMELAVGMGDDAAVDGGGITVKSSDGDKTLSFAATGDNWASSEHFSIASNKLYKVNNVEVLSAAGAVKVQSGVAGAGLGHNAGVLSVNVDDSSIEENSDSLRVKALGITNAMLAGSIANGKLANSTISGKALGTNLDALTAEANHGIALSGAYDGQTARTISMDWEYKFANFAVSANNSIVNATEDGQANCLKIPSAFASEAAVASTHPMAQNVKIYRNGVLMQLEYKGLGGTLNGAHQFKLVNNAGNVDVYIRHAGNVNAKTDEFSGDDIQIELCVTN